MGMFDTVYFEKKYSCPDCHRDIESLQVKEFENLLEEYYVKDCISHADQIRLAKDELYCDKCKKHTGKAIYIVVNRGLFAGTAETLYEAKNLLNDLNAEKLILWYHDLYKKYVKERREKDLYIKFLEDLREWYGESLHKESENAVSKRIWLVCNLRHLKGALNPVESVDRFMTYKKMIEALNKLWKEGHEILDIYYPEEISFGEEKWAVDVYQDEINELCSLNWTWTVLNKKQLESESEKEDKLPDWAIVADGKFSDEIVCSAVEKWLRNKSFDFGVKMISINDARGSGLIKNMKQMDMDMEKESGVSLNEVIIELQKEEEERNACLIERLKDREKVFYYRGFYGSLVPDVESYKLIGKVEGIKEVIFYEGKTIKECEQKFRDAINTLT